MMFFPFVIQLHYENGLPGLGLPCPSTQPWQFNFYLPDQVDVLQLP